MNVKEKKYKGNTASHTKMLIDIAPLISAISASVAATFAIASLFFGYIKYIEIERERYLHSKIDRVMQFEERFHSEKLIIAREQVEAAWLGENNECYDYHIASFYAGGLAWVNHQHNVISSNNFSTKNVYAITRFYNNLAICVENDICDKETAFSFFRSYGDDFMLHHIAYFCSYDYTFSGTVRERYAKGLVDFLNMSYGKDTTYLEYMNQNCGLVSEALASNSKEGVDWPKPEISANCERWYSSD